MRVARAVAVPVRARGALVGHARQERGAHAREARAHAVVEPARVRAALAVALGHRVLPFTQSATTHTSIAHAHAEKQ